MIIVNVFARQYNRNVSHKDAGETRKALSRSEPPKNAYC